MTCNADMHLIAVRCQSWEAQVKLSRCKSEAPAGWPLAPSGTPPAHTMPNQVCTSGIPRDAALHVCPKAVEARTCLLPVRSIWSSLSFSISLTTISAKLHSRASCSASRVRGLISATHLQAHGGLTGQSCSQSRLVMLCVVSGFLPSRILPMLRSKAQIVQPGPLTTVPVAMPCIPHNAWLPALPACTVLQCSAVTSTSSSITPVTPRDQQQALQQTHRDLRRCPLEAIMATSSTSTPATPKDDQQAFQHTHRDPRRCPLEAIRGAPA